MKKIPETKTNSIELTTIKKASLAKRIAALVMDGVVALFTFGLLGIFVFTNIANAAFGYENKMESGYECQVFSGLYILEAKYSDDSDPVIINNGTELNEKGTGIDSNVTSLDNYEFENIEDYKARLEYYYCNYLTNTNVVWPKGCPDTITTLTNSDGSEVSNREWFEANISPLTEKDDVITACYKAEEHLYNLDFYQEIQKELKLIQMLVIVLPSFLITFGVYYFLIPMLFKNGETLGKKVTHIALISNDNYAVKKRQIVFRQLLIMFYVAFCSSFIGIGLTSISTLALGVFIYFISMLISKQNRSFFDAAAYTLVVDANTSVWFKDEEDEKLHKESVEHEMSKLKKYRPNDKNIIQIGSKVINKNVKKTK